jgi:protocatechuate 3,4-dioxygenase, beta subunit
MENLSRRESIKKAFLAAGSFLAVTKLAQAKACLELTPDQVEGPFYPENDQTDKDNDLTQLKGSKKVAKGEIVIINGIVTDQDCKPVENALVEIWQACATGKYKHLSDPNPAKLDPDFQYWGRAYTDKEGRYSFKTIRPGSYPATSTWTRPAHIHFKVHRLTFEELTTQMYFKDDIYNKNDNILQSLSETDRDKVIVDFKIVEGSPHKVGQFDISIRSLV